MRKGLAVGLGALVLVACPSPPGPPVTRVPVLDAGPSRDAGHDANGADAFRWPDTGPQAPPVLPAQSWEVGLAVGTDVVDLVVSLDARAESGIVRAVVGGGGRSTTLVFDVDGGTLVARAPVKAGLPGEHLCSPDTVVLSGMRLEFDDHDGDGTHEALVRVSVDGVVGRSSGSMPPLETFERVVLRSIAPDTHPPVLALADPIPGGLPIELVASEPISPSFLPQLVGPRRIDLASDPTETAPARWTTGTIGLEAGHWELVLGTAEDLAGLAATDVPRLAFDVLPPAPVAIDDVDPEVVAIASAAPPIVWGDQPGETALRGTTSWVATAPLVIVIEVPERPVRTHFVQMLVLPLGPSTASIAAVYAAERTATPTPVGSGAVIAPLGAPSPVPGFGASADMAQFLSLSITPSDTGRSVIEVWPGGSPDPACSGSVVPDEGFGVVVDEIQVD